MVLLLFILILRIPKGELIHEYSYKLGQIQYYLAKRQESWLPITDYPFPPNDEN